MKPKFSKIVFPFFILAALFAFLNSLPGYAQVRRMDRGLILRSARDTIKIKGANVYVLDQAKIRKFKTGAARDSLKTPLADRKDMAAYQNAVDRLKNILEEDPYENAANYINLEAELVLPDTDKIPVNLDVTSGKYPVPKLLLNQLTFNIHMIRELVSNPIREKSSLRILDMLIENNKSLSSQTVFSLGTMVLMKHTSYPKYSVEVLDSSQAPIPAALGYLVSNDVVRKAGYTFCDFTVKPCPSPEFRKIVVNTSQPYVKLSGSQPEQVPFGKYHVFVTDGNTIYYTGSKRVNESAAGTEKIKVQLP
ncbi:MAG: hypothetical protein ACO1O1_03765 [Adhaeribacter sp.]